MWGTPAAGVVDTTIFVPFLPLPTVNNQRGRAAQRAQARVARRLARPVGPWCADVWTEVAADRLPARERGYAQLPVLAVACALSLLIGVLPALLLG